MKKLLFILLLLPLFLNAQIIPGVVASGIQISGGGGGGGEDSDVEAFKTATGVSGSAIDSLVKWLKDSSLWSKADAIYPIAGSTASSHSYNLKNTSTFQLVYSGTWTHSSNAMKGNGSNAYANTNWVPSTQSDPTTKAASAGIWLNTASNGAYVDLGSKNSSNYYFQIYSSFGYNFYGQPNENNRIPETVSVNDAQGSKGWFFINRSDINNTYLQRDLTRATFHSDNSADAAAPEYSVYLGAQNSSGTASGFSAREINFVWLGKSLTTTEADQLYTIISNYKSLL